MRQDCYPAGGLKAQAADSGYIADGDLTANSTPAPEKDAVVPDANQYWYQKAELSAFCHFGPNTFNEIEWGENYGDKTSDEIFKLEENFDADTMVRTLKNAGFQFIGGTNKWANSGAKFTTTFTGSKLYLLGAKDPNHGKVDVYIDGEKAATIDTAASARSLGQVIFASPDLPHGEHTLELRVTSKAIGIESACVINNNGLGMIGLEMDSYTMGENERMEVKLVRVGGTSDRSVTVHLSPNPGSAIQDDCNTELSTKVAGLILGFDTVATVTIRDRDSVKKDELQALVEEVQGLQESWYAEGWEGFAQALDTAKAVVQAESPAQSEIADAYFALLEARELLAERETYTQDDPFYLPAQTGETGNPALLAALILTSAACLSVTAVELRKEKNR